MPPIARLNDSISHGGSITSASPDCFCNGIAIARLGDSAVCSIHGGVSITTSSNSVFANGQGVARVGDSVSCGATISSGSDDSFAGD